MIVDFDREWAVQCTVLRYISFCFVFQHVVWWLACVQTEIDQTVIGIDTHVTALGNIGVNIIIKIWNFRTVRAQNVTNDKK